MFSSTDSKADDVETILQRLNSLEVEEPRQTQEGVQLLRQLNRAQAKTSPLATEILALIFLFASPLVRLDREGREYNPWGWFGHRFFPLTIGQVSHHWRQVAWSTPQLWAALSLHIYMRTKIKSTIGLLNLYLKNVSNYPISIDLDLPPTPHAREICAAVDNALFSAEHTRKIRFLQIINIPDGWTPSFSGFARLQHLSLDGQIDLHQKSIVLDLTDVHSLSRISFRNVNPRIKLPWGFITILELDSVTTDLCGELLVQCMNLVKFRAATLHRPRYGWRADDNLLTSSPPRLIYRHLEEFRWNHITDPHFLALFNRIELPSLRQLSWSQPGLTNTTDNLADSETFPYIKALFSDLPQSLIAVRFHHLCVWPTSTLQYVLPRINNVEELSLRYCHKDTVRNFLSVLNLPSTYYLPSLRSLIINYCYGASSDTSRSTYPIFHSTDENSIVGFIVERFERGMAPHFRMELLNVNTDWEISLLQSFNGLVKKGMKLELIVNGKKLNWEREDLLSRKYWDKRVYNWDRWDY